MTPSQPAPETNGPRRTGVYPPRYRRLWLIYLVFGMVAIGAYYAAPTGPAANFIYELIGLSAAGAMVLGAQLHRPQRRLPWYLMAVGTLLWTLADTIGNIYESEFPTPADVFYLLGYPVLATGLWLLIRGRHRGLDQAGLLDSLIFTTALAVLSWVLLAEPVLRSYQDSPAAALIAVSYPIGDILLASMLIRLLATPSGRTRAYLFLVIALITLIVADTASTALDRLSADASVPLDFLWFISYIAWGTAALDPTMVSLSAPTSASFRFTRKRLMLLTVAALVAPVTLAVQATLFIPLSVWPVVVGSALTFVLVIARMQLSMIQIRSANEAKAAAEAELTHQAAHDSLTGLANRKQAVRQIVGALSRAQRSGAAIGLLFVDLDDFKQVNDTLGHQAGDEVLKTAARRMEQAVRPGDLVARLGGDEFLVLLEPLDDQASGVFVADRVVAALSEPILLRSGHEARIGASAGLAVSQDGDTSADRLLSEADLAVYRAKAAGRGRTEVFDRALRERLQHRNRLEHEIRTAIDSDAMQLVFDPVVELLTGEPVGFDARLGCHIYGEPYDRASLTADLGPSPALFDLDSWCLRRAAQIFAELGPEIGPLVLGVPISGQHLSQNRFINDIDEALGAAGLSGDQLTLILDSADAADDLRALGNLEVLRARKVTVCFSGLGAGSGPTNAWLQLPVASVRLDPTLLRAASKSDHERGPATPIQLLKLTVQTAHAFGYRVIAPAIDDNSALAIATAAGCDYGQGEVLAELLTDQTVEYGPLLASARN